MFSRMPRWFIGISVVGTGIGAVVLLKDPQGTRYEGEEKITGKTVIITGANTGLGKETAKELAKRGGKIIMACRDEEKCEAARKEVIELSFNRNIHCKKLDLASLKSIRNFAEDINKNEKHLEILVNNAAVMACPKSLTKEGFEMQLGVNHLGHFLLTNLLLDKLKRSAPSRIINVTSLPHKDARINFKDLNSAKDYEKKRAYMQSKLANMMFTLSLEQRLKGSGVSTCSVYPGLARTELGRHLGMNKSMISGPILAPVWFVSMKQPVQAAQDIIYCALSPQVEKHSGAYFFEFDHHEHPPQALDWQKAERLWQISEAWTKLNDTNT